MSESGPMDAMITEEAVRWLARRDRGPALSAAERLEFEVWLQADSRHWPEYERVAGHWARLDELVAFQPTGARPAVADLPLKPRRPRRRRLTRRLAPLAVAASLALVAGLSWWQFARTELHTHFAQTEVGLLEDLSLPDGSTITLNTGSAVRVELTKFERRIDLVRGEAYFSVSPDETRPFVVSVGEVRVRALGTAFSVRRYATEVEVLVAHGRVGVADATHNESLLAPTALEPQPTLTAGQRTVIRETEPGAAVESLTALDVARRLAWKERRLEFGPTALRTIIDEFNRYSPRPLVLGDEALGDLSVGGSFRVGDAEALLMFLKTSFSIEVEYAATETILRARR